MGGGDGRSAFPPLSRAQWKPGGGRAARPSGWKGARAQWGEAGGASDPGCPASELHTGRGPRCCGARAEIVGAPSSRTGDPGSAPRQEAAPQHTCLPPYLAGPCGGGHGACTPSPSTGTSPGHWAVFRAHGWWAPQQGGEETEGSGSPPEAFPGWDGSGCRPAGCPECTVPGGCWGQKPPCCRDQTPPTPPGAHDQALQSGSRPQHARA